MIDLKTAARLALKSTTPGVGLDVEFSENPWAFFGNYIDRVVIQTVNALTPKW
jgi:hypothetical protein